MIQTVSKDHVMRNANTILTFLFAFILNIKKGPIIFWNSSDSLSDLLFSAPGYIFRIAFLFLSTTNLSSITMFVFKNCVSFKYSISYHTLSFGNIKVWYNIVWSLYLYMVILTQFTVFFLYLLVVFHIYYFFLRYFSINTDIWY